MNLEYGNIVKIFLKSQVEKIENNKVIVKAGEVPVTVNAADFTVSSSVSQSKASLLTSTPISLYINKLSAEASNIFKIKRSVIVEICKSNDESQIIGSLSYPAKLILTKSLNQDILKIEHKQPSYLD
ncbi:MAG: hypothetical protein PHQ67_07155 [Fermentimonas sp.]|nr:hypothetical protein [Fermentimonas sp.]MDD4009575.1 hypothetical protein [Fermentimonas sp.]MDD4698181.1 hypothetical protein [Fermentimonas sp.]